MKLATGYLLSPIMILFGAVTGGKADVIYAYSPPLLMAYVGWLVALMKGAIFVLGVQDLHPQAYIDQGILKNRLLIKILRHLEKLACRLADVVTVHSKGNQEHVLRIAGAKMHNVEVIPNWVNIENVIPLARFNRFSNDLDLRGKFVVGYAGTIGLSQGTECVIDAANILRERKDIHFLVVGDGIEKPSIVKRASKFRLENISFLKMQTEEDYPYVIASFDVGLVTLNSKVKTPVIPSKIISLMAAERPIIASLPEGDAADLIRTANSGIVVRPESPENLAESIVMLMGDRDISESFGKNGRRYVVDNLTVERSVIHLENLISVMKRNVSSK
jgi:glycosyltransferase involved in cell wall biosynthesis